MKLDVIDITDKPDGSCNIMFEMDKQAAEIFIQYALKDILVSAAEKVVDEQDSDNSWHVMIDIDSGSYIHYPWLTKYHAQKLCDIMNEIESARTNRLGGTNDSHLYSIKQAEKNESR